MSDQNMSFFNNWNASPVLDDVEFQESEARQFLDLLRGEGDETPLALLRPGQILKGTVVEVTKDYAVVDVGLKSEGLIAISEFGPEKPTLGASVEVYLDQTEGDNGQIVLSRDKARKIRQWEHIATHCKEGSTVTGTVLRKVKGGLMVDIGMEAFLPGSQIDNKRIRSLDDFIGRSYEFKILKINLERKNVVVSRREFLEEERSFRKAELLEHIEPGALRKGIVKNITDFGAFLDLDGIDGLLHITDMTWKRIKHSSELLQVGQEIEVQILHVDKEKGRVALGLKQKEPNPWEGVERKYPVGTRLKVKVVHLVTYGAFAEIEPGIEGLIHTSDMSWTKNITDPNEMVKIGDEVEVIVLSIQKDEGKIALGMKQAQRDPWVNVKDRYPIGARVQAEVRNFINYGAFVELEPGVDGLIHISDLSWNKKITHPSEVLQKGEKVEAIVLSVDEEAKKISLGIKQLQANPWDILSLELPVGSVVNGTITKTTTFGAFVQLDNGLEGLIHSSELSDHSFAKIEDVVKKGDQVQAKVIKIDSENKKISLSLKDTDESFSSPSPQAKKKKKGKTKRSAEEGFSNDE